MMKPIVNRANVKYYLFGIFGIFFLFLDIYSKIFYLNLPGRIFWFCSLGFFVTLIGYFRKKSLILSSVFCLMFIVELMWIVSFFVTLIFQADWGNINVFTKYIFDPNYPKVRLFATMYHFLILPIMIMGFYKIKKVHKYGFVGAALLMYLLLVLGYFFPDVADNMNCSYMIPGDSCYKIFRPFYSLGYLIGYPVVSAFLGIVVFLPFNYFLIKFAKKNDWVVEKKFNI